jgi:protein-tyrosine phosphatase
MIDLHCHVLPGIDDGAASLDDSRALLELAAADGIKQLVATPHIHPGVFDNTKALIEASLQRLLRLPLSQSLQVAVAAEVRLTEYILPAVEQQQLPFLGNYQGMQVLLLEFPHSHVPAGADKLVRWLLQRNILPMIAHPERNRDVQANPAVLAPFRRMNCLFQLTASSITGELGERHQQCAIELLQQRLFHVVASDMHSANRRPPRMSLAKQRIIELCGDEYAMQLTQQNAAAIVSSQTFYAVGTPALC